MISGMMLLFLLLVLQLTNGQSDDFYRIVFEEIDPDVILDNERLLKTYIRCFLDEGPCNDHAAAVKESIPKTMETVCGECSPKQRDIYKYILNKFIPAHPNEWSRIQSKYDPNLEYWPKLKAFMES